MITDKVNGSYVKLWESEDVERLNDILESLTGRINSLEKVVTRILEDKFQPQQIDTDEEQEIELEIINLSKLVPGQWVKTREGDTAYLIGVDKYNNDYVFVNRRNYYFACDVDGDCKEDFNYDIIEILPLENKP